MATDALTARTHRVEIYSPAGQWKWGQRVRLDGHGTYADRCERAALDTLSCEPAGTIARVFRYAPLSTGPMTKVMTVTLPAVQS